MILIMKKTTFYFLFILFSVSLNAQVRAFAGGTVYRDTEFQESGYLEITSGIDVKVYKFFKPEASVSYYFGRLEDYNKLDQAGNTISISQATASALNFGFTPKICLSWGEESAGDAVLQILPRYNIARIEAQQNYTLINQSNPAQSKTQKSIVTEWQHSLGIGLGLDIMLSDKNYNSLAINLYYTGVDMGKALTEVKKSNTNYDTTTLGLGINYYFGFRKKKEERS
jgi:opacity protein-like surface antigen